MDVTSLKYSIIERLMRTDDEKLLKKVAKLMAGAAVPYPEPDIKPMTVEELNERIRQSRKDVAEGKTHTSEELRKHFRNK